MDYITFEYETSENYPFGIPYDEINIDYLDFIIDECDDINDTNSVYLACIIVLGSNEGD